MTAYEPGWRRDSPLAGHKASPGAVDQSGADVSQVAAPAACIGAAWEEAYLRFQTPEEEVRKFMRRLRWLGAHSWPRDARITEICCGRGGGLEALARLGFSHVEGVDLSASLLGRYRGRFPTILADCRSLPLLSSSRDVVIVQGGLHHVEPFPEGLLAALREVQRVLRPGGRFVVVEPWATPFLTLVHAACRIPLARAVSSKLRAMEAMNRLERHSYERWLSSHQSILRELRARFEDEYVRRAWGKLWYVGRKHNEKAEREDRCQEPIMDAE